MRPDNRNNDELRRIKITKNFISTSPGAVLLEAGRLKVLCTANVEESIPPFLKNTGKGWLTAEYAMLPGSTLQRKQRDKAGKVDGRSVEIQRLIGRALRSVVDMELLGERTIWIDCDVLEADGGTRTASITASFLAVSDLVKSMLKEKRIMLNPIKDHVAAVSVGVIKGSPILDLCYEEDFAAEVDMNVVMTKSGHIVEIQGTAEHKPFSEQTLNELLALAKKGLNDIFRIQTELI